MILPIPFYFSIIFIIFNILLKNLLFEELHCLKIFFNFIKHFVQIFNPYFNINFDYFDYFDLYYY